MQRSGTLETFLSAKSFRTYDSGSLDIVSDATSAKAKQTPAKTEIKPRQYYH